VTRFKNKLKAIYRRVGIKPTGDGIYEKKNREAWKEKLSSHKTLHLQASHIFSLIDSLEAKKTKTFSSITKRVDKNPAFSLLQSMPGAGPVTASGYIALILTPYRFSRKNKLWKYANLANVYHESDGKVYKNKKDKTGNRVLKWLVFEHYHFAVRCSKAPNKFKMQDFSLRSRGLSDKAARRHVCRSILSTVRAIWMKGEPYKDKHYKIVD
jgi:transposase